MTTAVLAWEEKWKKMLTEYPDARIPDLWKMAAIQQLCPKEIRDVLDVQWDEIGEDFTKMKAKIIAWATNRAEKKGGAVPMDIGAAMEMEEEAAWEQYWSEEDEWWFDEGPGAVNAVHPSTQCYNCGKYGHMAKGCTAKGNGKGGYATKGGGKAGGKKGKGKGGEKGWNEKGWSKGGKKGEKGAAKGSWGKGYQGQCFNCGQVGHKAWGCGSVQVAEVTPAAPPQGGVADGAEEDCDVAWSISAIDDHTEWEMVPNKVKATPVAALQRVVAPVRASRWAPMKVDISNRFGTLEEEAQFPALKASKVRSSSVQMEGVRSKDKPKGEAVKPTPFPIAKGFVPVPARSPAQRKKGPSSCWSGASAALCPRSPRRRRRSR